MNLKKIKLKTIVIAVSILIFIFCVILLKVVMINSECSSNAFVYGAKKIKDQGLEIDCSCDIYDKVSADRFYFDEEKVYKDPIVAINTENFNFRN